MSNCQIKFHYNQEDVIIQCKRNELMKDIIYHYGIKSGLSVGEFYFFYNEIKINLDLTLAQINDKDKEILIFVYSKENAKNKMKEPNIIKCIQCYEPAIVDFSNDYGIVLSDEKHGTKKIKLQDYNTTQIFYQSDIKCSKCSNSKAEIYQDKFYYCFECNKNLCPSCKSLHKEHKNIVDYSFKYFRCPQHQNQNFISYCLDCKKNLCTLCTDQHRKHNTINFSYLYQKQEQNKEYIERIQKVNDLVDTIIDSLKQFKDNLIVYLQIIEKLNENLLNMNFNYENSKSMYNLMEMSFLKEDLDYILNNNDIIIKFQKIMSIYDIMKGKNNNEVTIKVKIEENEINKTIYFLGNNKPDFLGGILCEINNNNTTLIIDGKKESFKKYFTPSKSGIYTIKLLFRDKLKNCSNMFCDCRNIINIDFSKFKTDKVNEMKCMFRCCSSLTSLDLRSFDTNNVNDMQLMFDGCSSLTILNLSSFETEFVSFMNGMFEGCNSLKKLDLRSFNTKRVKSMSYMFSQCSSLVTLNLSSFKTDRVEYMSNMFSGCKSLIALDLRSFNTENVYNISGMFCGCSSLTTLNLSSFSTKNVEDMSSMFDKCFSLTILNLSSFITDKVYSDYDMPDMFNECINLSSCGSSDENIIDLFNNK